MTWMPWCVKRVVYDGVVVAVRGLDVGMMWCGVVWCGVVMYCVDVEGIAACG